MPGYKFASESLSFRNNSLSRRRRGSLRRSNEFPPRGLLFHVGGMLVADILFYFELFEYSPERRETFPSAAVSFDDSVRCSICFFRVVVHESSERERGERGSELKS